MFQLKGDLLIFITAKTMRSEEHTSELQSQSNLVCRLLLEKKKKTIQRISTRIIQKKNTKLIKSLHISQLKLQTQNTKQTINVEMFTIHTKCNSRLSPLHEY